MVWHGQDSTPGNTTERGYGNDHMKARARAARHHQPTDPCARCGHPLGPWGSWLHLDHSADRTDYLGVSHGSRPCLVCGERCNLVAGAREGRRRQLRPTLRW